MECVCGSRGSFHFCLFSRRLGHENFELINHDVVEPLMIEGS